MIAQSYITESIRLKQHIASTFVNSSHIQQDESSNKQQTTQSTSSKEQQTSSSSKQPPCNLTQAVEPAKEITNINNIVHFDCVLNLQTLHAYMLQGSQ